MGKKYQIHWRSALTGMTGHGLISYDKEIAQSLCDASNKWVSGFTHWIEPEQVGDTMNKNKGFGPTLGQSAGWIFWTCFAVILAFTCSYFGFIAEVAK